MRTVRGVEVPSGPHAAPRGRGRPGGTLGILRVGGTQPAVTVRATSNGGGPSPPEGSEAPATTR
jgi:hypothetical protein